MLRQIRPYPTIKQLQRADKYAKRDSTKACVVPENMGSITLETFGLSDIGKAREMNEDALLVDDKHQVFAVADGLGGLPRGALASSLTIQYVVQQVALMNPGVTVEWPAVFSYVNLRVYREGHKINREIGIGSTLTIARIEGKHMSVGHVGDCTIFLCRNTKFKKITRDHTMEEEIRSRLQPGEETYIPEYFTHTLTRCIGQQETIEVDIFERTLQKGDRILICSDGITKAVAPEELHEGISSSAQPEAFVRKIIATANHRGGPDNATGIAIFVN